MARPFGFLTRQSRRCNISRRMRDCDALELDRQGRGIESIDVSAGAKHFLQAPTLAGWEVGAVDLVRFIQ